jgi:hypothetical protein
MLLYGKFEDVRIENSAKLKLLIRYDGTKTILKLNRVS